MNKSSEPVQGNLRRRSLPRPAAPINSAHRPVVAALLPQRIEQEPPGAVQPCQTTSPEWFRSTYRGTMAGLLAALCLLLTVTTALAQGRLVVVDDPGLLDQEQIAQAAQPLLDRGAVVAVYMVANGGQADFTRRLRAAELERNGRLDDNVIAIYVALNAEGGYSELAAGSRWDAALTGAHDLEVIRETQLNPDLVAGNFSDGFVNALHAFDQALASPTASAPGPTARPNLFAPMALVVLGLLGLLGLFGGWSVFRRRRAATQVLSAARQQTDDQRRDVGLALADIGRLLRMADEKAQFDRLSYTPTDVQRLSEIQQQVQQQFVAVQARFTQVGDTLAQQASPTLADYDQARQGYAEVQHLVTALQEQLEQLNARRVELDHLADQAAETIDRAKKKMSDVVECLEPLRGEIPDTASVLSPVQQIIAQAEQYQAIHDTHQAITRAETALETTATLADMLATYTTIRTGIVQARQEAEALANEGYRVDASHAALDQARKELTTTAQILQRQGITPAQPALEAAQTALATALAHGRGLVTLRAENEQRLAEIEQLGAEVAQLIMTGHETFDLVDEFAESTWSDIRGNGSEAEAAANRAQEHWFSARTRNTMQVQEFATAGEDLDAAAAELAYARSLIDAITQRLHDLQAARAIARAELEAAATDIARGWEFVRTHDPDVGNAPELQLKHAEQSLARARDEMQKEKPDWLYLVRQAQAANNLADEALTGARSEVEEMQKLRTKTEHARKLATAEVQKIVQFAGVHRQDIQPGSQQSIALIQQQVQHAYTLLQQAEQTVEEQRRAALQQAYASYTRLQTDAEQVYNTVYNDFQQLEQLRTTVNDELARARNALASAERTLTQYGAAVPYDGLPVRKLREAHRLFEQIRLPIAGEENLQSALRLARAIHDDAREAENEIIRSYRRPPQRGSGGGMGDFVEGMLIGSMLGSSGTRRHSGWGGSGRWSAGGNTGRSKPGRNNTGRSPGAGTRSAGSRSGGSWGGGSRSGGSWGSGSRSGGRRSGGGW